MSLSQGQAKPNVSTGNIVGGFSLTKLYFSTVLTVLFTKVWSNASAAPSIFALKTPGKRPGRVDASNYFTLNLGPCLRKKLTLRRIPGSVHNVGREKSHIQ